MVSFVSRVFSGGVSCSGGVQTDASDACYAERYFRLHGRGFLQHGVPIRQSGGRLQNVNVSGGQNLVPYSSILH